MVSTHPVNLLRTMSGNHITMAVILFIATVALYAPSLRYDFTMDDPLVTTRNRDVVKEDYVLFFTSSVHAGSPFEGDRFNLYRPLLKSSMALNFRLAGSEFDPYYFHAVNIVLYAVCAVVVFYLVRLLFNAKGDSDPAFAFLVAVLFMVFPSHLESVCNIKHREEVMACLFGLAAWLIVLQKRGSRSVVPVLAASLFFLMALFSKESAVLLFPCMIVWDYRSGNLVLKDLRSIPLYVVGCSAAIVVYFILRYNALGSLLSSPGTDLFFRSDETIVTRIAVASRVFFEYYIRDQLISLRLNPGFSDRFPIFYKTPPVFYTVVLCAGILGVLAVATWRTVRFRSRYFFWVLFFFCTSFLATNIIPVGTVGAFRLMFTPSLALCVLIVIALRIVADFAERHMHLSHRLKESLFYTAAAILVGYYGYHTSTLMDIWKDDGTLFSYSAGVEANNPMSHATVGSYYGRKNMPEKKWRFYENALNMFIAGAGRERLFSERSVDAFSVVATEVAFKELSRDPARAIELADHAIKQFDILTRIRKGKTDTNATAPYYVKALGLRNLGRTEESIAVCRSGLAIAYHKGIDALLQSLLEGG